MRRSILGLVVLCALCLGYAYRVEPYWPEAVHVLIRSPRLPVASRSIRVVHISDLHCDPEPRLEDRLPALIAVEKPDVILFSGDAINAEVGLPVFKHVMTRLAAIAPTFAVRGNWDAWYWPRVDLFGGTGVHELDGSAERIRIGDRDLWLAGVAVGHEDRAKTALSAVPAGSLTIFLYHYPYPDIIPGELGRGVDLFCAGHTHGGQVALPLYGAIITLSKYGKQYEAGLYRTADFWMYVNRGIGMEGGLAPRVRFWARPEVTTIEIAPEAGA